MTVPAWRVPKPVPPTMGLHPLCVALLVPVQVPVALCCTKAEWCGFVMPENTACLTCGGYFLSRSVQWYRSLRPHKPHTLAEQEWRVGDREVDVLWAMEACQQWVLWGAVVCSQQNVCLQTSYLPVCIKTLSGAKLDVKGTAGLQKGFQKGSFFYTSEIVKQSLMNYSQWQSAVNLSTYIYLEIWGRRKIWAYVLDTGPLGFVLQNSGSWSLMLNARGASGSRGGCAACECSVPLRAGVSTGVPMRQQLLSLNKTKIWWKKELA